MKLPELQKYYTDSDIPIYPEKGTNMETHKYSATPFIHFSKDQEKKL